MALSRIVYTGDGVTDQYAIPFALGYIREADVTCRVGDEVDGLGDPLYRDLVFTSATLVEIQGATPGDGIQIIFDRTVSRDALLVDYEDGDILNEVNLNTSQKQALMLVQEVLDGRFEAFLNDIDMGGFKITNLGSATDNLDAVNKAYVDAKWESAGDITFYSTYADAVSALPSLAEGQAVEVYQDETRTGTRTRYQVVGGSLVFKATMSAEQPVYASTFGVNGSATAAENTAAVIAAIADAVARNVREVVLPGVQPVLLFNSFSVPKSIAIRGVLQESTVLGFSPGVGVDAITFTEDGNTSTKGGLSRMTIVNLTSNLAGMAVSTALDGNSFARDTDFIFEQLQFRGGPWTKYLRVGDCNQGTIRALEIRAGYNPAITDVGQNACIGIELAAATGNIGVTMDNIMLVGVRQGVHIGNQAEGFHLVNSEIVASYIGVLLDSNPSKPGGFIDNVHMNCNYRCIDGLRRRGMNIGSVQLYRSDGWFNHGNGWWGVRLDTSSNCTIGEVLLRVGPGYTDTSYGVDVQSCSNTSITTLIEWEAGNIDVILNVVNSPTTIHGKTIANGSPVWVSISGTSGNSSFGEHVNGGAVPSTTPFVVSLGTPTLKTSVKFNRSSCGFAKYTDHGSYSVAGTEVLYPGFSGECHKYSLIVGAGTYTRNIDLDTVSAVTGDVFELKFTFLNTTNPTVVIRQGAGGSTLVSLNNGTGANWFPKLRFVFNGTGWVLDYQISSVA